MNNQKQYGVWMDSQNASVVGSESTEGPLSVIAHVKGEAMSPGSNEKGSNKFFKEIASHMVNATHVHVTGTGQAQEQFIHFLEATPQFKNSKTEESTSNKMSDEKLVEYMTTKFG